MTDQQMSRMQLIRRKKKKNIIHEIYLYDYTLVKRFVKIALLPAMNGYTTASGNNILNPYRVPGPAG